VWCRGRLLVENRVATGGGTFGTSGAEFDGGVDVHVGRGICRLDCLDRFDADKCSNVRLIGVVRTSRMTEARRSSLYEAEGLGGETTMRAKVIRELIDEIRTLRREMAEAGVQKPVSRPEL